MASPDEMIPVLNALGSNTSDDSALALAEFLKYQTDQRESGRSPEDFRIVDQRTGSLRCNLCTFFISFGQVI